MSQTENLVPDAVGLLKSYCKQKRIYKAALARKMGVNYKVVIYALKNKTIEFDKLVAFCHGLGYNFLLDLAHQLPSHYAKNEDLNKDYETKIASLEAKIATLETENKLLREIVMPK